MSSLKEIENNTQNESKNKEIINNNNDIMNNYKEKEKENNNSDNINNDNVVNNDSSDKPNNDKNVKLLPGKLADIAPTILHILGIEPPVEMNGTSLIQSL